MPDTYTSEQLSEENTVLALIRTSAIFGGLCALLMKKRKIAAKIIVSMVILILTYRLYNLKHEAHKNYVRFIGFLVIVCLFLLIVL